MREFLANHLPRSIRKILRKIYYLPKDVFKYLLDKDDLLPPRGRIDIGSGDFKVVGEEFMNYFRDLCQIRPEASVLDVGCGIGRMAIPLTKFLNMKGVYEGFDIVRDDINWCQKKITSKYPNFHFQVADVYNKDYNPVGKFKASEFRFPYDDEKFDFVFLTSVFTHMLPDDVENYLSEIKRVMKVGTRNLITYFLLNDESTNLMKSGKSTLDFRYHFGKYSSTHKRVPEAVIAFNEEYIKQLYSKHGFHIIQPIHYGFYCQREKYLSYQDIIIASRQ